MRIKSNDIAMVSIPHIVPNPKNMNEHPPEQIDRLAKLIEYQGFRNPLIISNRSGFLVVGHGRLEAAKKLGMSEVPVIYQDFDSEAQEYAYMTSDNAIAEWASLDLGKINQEMLEFGPDFDIDLLGIKDFVLEPIEKFEPQADEDDVPEVVDPITKRGDVWILGRHRVMCGDAAMIDDVEKVMDNKCPDYIYTDPPYGRGRQKSFNDNFKEYQDDNPFDLMDLNFFDAPFFIWGGNYYDPIPFDRKSLKWVVWDKRPSWESWEDMPEKRDAADRRFGQHFELAFTSESPMAGKMLRKTWGGCFGDVNGENKIVHKTQKPIMLAEKSIPDKYKKILDLFLGSGSTLIACEKTGRSCYGLEIDEHYCDVIVKRWQEYTGQEAVLESNGMKYNDLVSKAPESE